MSRSMLIVFREEMSCNITRTYRDKLTRLDTLWRFDKEREASLRKGYGSVLGWMIAL